MDRVVHADPDQDRADHRVGGIDPDSRPAHEPDQRDHGQRVREDRPGHQGARASQQEHERRCDHAEGGEEAAPLRVAELRHEAIGEHETALEVDARAGGCSALERRQCLARACDVRRLRRVVEPGAVDRDAHAIAAGVVEGLAPVASRVLGCGDERDQFRCRGGELVRRARRASAVHVECVFEQRAEAMHVAGARLRAQQRLDAREERERRGVPRAQTGWQRHGDLGRHRLAEVRFDHAQRTHHERLLAEAEVAGVVQPL